MTAVDVLAVMELARADASASRFWEWHDQLATAVEAIRELIEADVAFDDGDQDNDREFRAIALRRRVALARVRGES